MAIVFVYGLALASISVALMVYPDRCAELAIRYCNWRYLHPLETLINASFGGVFLYFAEDMRYALVFRIYGTMLLLIALVLVFVPPGWHRNYGVWSIGKCRPILRPASLVSFAFAVFIMYSTFRGPTAG